MSKAPRLTDAQALGDLTRAVSRLAPEARPPGPRGRRGKRGQRGTGRLPARARVAGQDGPRRRMASGRSRAGRWRTGGGWCRWTLTGPRGWRTPSGCWGRPARRPWPTGRGAVGGTSSMGCWATGRCRRGPTMAGTRGWRCKAMGGRPWCRRAGTCLAPRTVGHAVARTGKSPSCLRCRASGRQSRPFSGRSRLLAAVADALGAMAVAPQRCAPPG